jgi:hypothetical protein
MEWARAMTRKSGRSRRTLIVVLGLGLTAPTVRATEAPVPAGVLSSYAGLVPAHTIQTKALWRADPVALAQARTARIAPVKIAPGGADRVTTEQGALVANELARTLCARLSGRFRMVPSTARADLTVRATITQIRPTNTMAATASLGARVVARVVGSPVAPRVPIGLGGLSAEGETMDRRGVQRAALVWNRDANDLLTGARASHIGDAYQLAAAFAGDLARLTITGRDPLREVTAPHLTRKAPQAACAVYGRGERSGYVSGMFGIAPEATDQGAPGAKADAPK